MNAHKAEKGSPRATHRRVDVSPPRQDVAIRTASPGEGWTHVEAAPSARELALQAENKQLQAKINDLEQRLEQLTMGSPAPFTLANVQKWIAAQTHAVDQDSTPDTAAASAAFLPKRRVPLRRIPSPSSMVPTPTPPQADLDRLADPNRRIYCRSGNSANSDLSENFRAMEPVKVHANFSNEWKGVHLTVDSRKLFLVNSDTKTVSGPEWLLRMMKCDNMADSKEIRQLLDRAPDVAPGGLSIYGVEKWLNRGTPYGTAELLHRVKNHDQKNPEFQDENRALEKNMLSEIEGSLANGKFDYFLFIRGIHSKEYMLVSSANAAEGTMTYRSYPSAVCETRAPFIREWPENGVQHDRLEDWHLYGIKADQRAYWSPSHPGSSEH
ncbi:hypothetical protein [Bordetella sp. LUAb4]|uniref:hypothetical protein n=1 Tax=Bordetella sp. LUAb4 TaxID=2843195 RepID=UPI001E51EFEC|nr:hypothetical protein [Bordetella sp. LUAb4]